MSEINLVGKTISGYKVAAKIGSGSYGTVYEVIKKNEAGEHIRALKHITIPSEKQYDSVINSMGGDVSKANSYFKGILDSIISEINILEHLSKQGIKNMTFYYDSDIESSKNPLRYDVYIFMEYLTPMDDYIKKAENYCVRDVIKLGKDILTGLGRCHDNDVIHRDIKNDNIFVSDEGDYKIGDFGVSKVLKGNEKAETLKGTADFMAPEVRTKREYTVSVDLYSLGIVMYRLLNCNRNPFLPQYPEMYTSDDEDMAFGRRMNGEVPSLPMFGGVYIGEVLVKALSDSSSRYHTAGEFIEALTEAENKTDEAILNTKVNITDNKKPDTEVSNEQVIIKTEDYSKTIGENYYLEEKDNSEDDVEQSINSYLFEDIDKKKESETEDEDINYDGIKKKKNLLKTMLCITIIAIIGIIIIVILLNYGNNEENVPEEVVVNTDNDRNESEGVNQDTVATEAPTAEMVVVPNIENTEDVVAKSKIEVAGLKYVVEKEIYSDTIAAGIIVTQNPAAGQLVAPKSEVVVIISMGSDKIEVPRVEGFTEKEAKKQLKECGLKVKVKYEYSNSVDKGFVMRQSVDQGKMVEKKTTINITVSKGEKAVSNSSISNTTVKKPDAGIGKKPDNNKSDEWDLKPGF